jgi:hypothetical protein
MVTMKGLHNWVSLEAENYTDILDHIYSTGKRMFNETKSPLCDLVTSHTNFAGDLRLRESCKIIDWRIRSQWDRTSSKDVEGEVINS